MVWWAIKDSNLGPSRCKRDALPTELIARELILPCIATKIETENKKFFWKKELNIRGIVTFFSQIKLNYPYNSERISSTQQVFCLQEKF